MFSLYVANTSLTAVSVSQAELQLVKQQLEESKQRVESQKAEQQKLQKIIADADAEQMQQKKQLDQVKNKVYR